MSALKMLTRIITEQGYKRLRDKPKKLRNFNRKNLSLQEDREGYRVAYARMRMRRGFESLGRKDHVNLYTRTGQMSKEDFELSKLREIERGIKEYDREIIKLKGYNTKIVKN